MRVFVEGVGLLGPGLAGWEASRAVLAGEVPYVQEKIGIPAGTLLPPTERRRIGAPVKLALAVGTEAFARTTSDSARTATVFASSGGDGDTVHQICSVLASTQREVSPTGFHNSVHNAAAGYWSIAVGCREASTSVACHEFSFAAGLLEAVVQVVEAGAPVALIAYDHPYPEPLHSVRPLAADFAVAMVMTPTRTQGTLAALEIQYDPRVSDVSRMHNPGLETLRIGVPAARSLPLLSAMAGAGEATIVLEYGEDAQLTIAVSPPSTVGVAA